MHGACIWWWGGLARASSTAAADDLAAKVEGRYRRAMSKTEAGRGTGAGGVRETCEVYCARPLGGRIRGAVDAYSCAWDSRDTSPISGFSFGVTNVWMFPVSEAITSMTSVPVRTLSS